MLDTIKVALLLAIAAATSSGVVAAPKTRARSDYATATVHQIPAPVNSVPILDVEAGCKQTPDTVLIAGQDVKRCFTQENAARNQLTHAWAAFSIRDRFMCTQSATAGGGGTYTDLLTCLEMEVAAKDLRAKYKSDVYAGQ